MKMATKKASLHINVRSIYNIVWVCKVDKTECINTYNVMFIWVNPEVCISFKCRPTLVLKATLFSLESVSYTEYNE